MIAYRQRGYTATVARERWKKGPAHTFVPVEELARIDEAAKQSGMTRAMFLRMAANAAANAVLAGRVPPWFTAAGRDQRTSAKRLRPKEKR